LTFTPERLLSFFAINVRSGENDVNAAPANRFLEVLAEPTALQVVRELVEGGLTQAALVEKIGISQSIVSRTIKNLRGAGLIESDTPRGALRIRAEDECLALLSAADRFAEAVLKDDLDQQGALSTRTRRARIRTTAVDAESAVGAPDASR
jgi:DNA-binding transcriptional ArsR family regulator